MFDYSFNIAGIVIRIESPYPLEVDDSFNAFASNAAPRTVIRLEYYQDRERAPMERIGKDLLMTYYRSGDVFVAQSYGMRGPVASIQYDPDFTDVRYEVNLAAYPDSVISVGKVMQLFPIRRLLMRCGAIMLHSSQVELDGGGILFCAPSGTGKSTQARLWQQHASARIICNDRTILKHCKKITSHRLLNEENSDSIWYTHSYPADGSTPVNYSAQCRLAAIVLLRQGPQELIQSPSPAVAIRTLLEQSLIDVWDPHMRALAVEMLADIVASSHIYSLACTPTKAAVDCLRERLRKDGVFDAISK